eukprot:scaffold18018_cov42-Phaeocystis_antarctica.AAC.1
MAAMGTPFPLLSDVLLFPVSMLSSEPASATVGADSIVTPSAAEASAAVPRVEESEVCTAAAVVEAGTAMVAVMITLAAATAMVTSDSSTPAAVAMPCRKLEVSE